MRCRTNLHRFFGDVNTGQFFELVVHAGQLAFDVLGGIWKFLLDPGNVQEDAAVWRSASLFDLAAYAPGNMIARKQFRRSLRILVALCISPAFLLVRAGLVSVVLRNVVEHKPAAILVAEHAALAANS